MRFLPYLPLLIIIVIGLVFLQTILFGEPGKIHTPLNGREIPQFTLSALLEDTPGFSSEDLQKEEIALVNFWASWCAPCRAEHPVLQQLAQKHKIPIYGVNYKDKPELARAFIDELGNPYHKIGIANDPDFGIAWGVFGLPETYLIGSQGRILYKHIGPILPGNMERIVAEITKLRTASGEN